MSDPADPATPPGSSETLDRVGAPPAGWRLTPASLLWPLEERVLKETRNQVEQVIALDASGTELLIKTGHHNQVSLSRREMDHLRGRVDVLTHNHPSGTGIGFADLSIALTLGARELHAFDWRVRYRLVRSPSGWPALTDVERDLEQIRKAVRRRLNNRLRTGAISVQEYSLQYWHDIWTRYAQRIAAVQYLREDRAKEAK